MILESMSTSEALKYVAKILLKLAARIEISNDQRPSGAAKQRANEKMLIERALPMLTSVARDEYNARRERSRHLDPSLFGELSWDILLDLFIHHGLGKRVSVTSACIASAGATTTALRHLTLLQEAGLISRDVSMADKRVAYIGLTDKGLQDIASYLNVRASTRAIYGHSETIEDFMFATEDTSS